MYISVVIPLYNKAPYVGAALASVIGQQRRPDEIIVVDDGSTDDGPAIVSAIPGVKMIRQANAGVSAARNAGIAAARGDLVALLDADDCWLPNFLEEIDAAARSHPEAGIICAGYRRMSEAGPGTEHTARSVARGSTSVLPSFYADWSRDAFTCASSIALRRTLLMRLGVQFPIGERLGEDQDLWFRMAESAPVVHIAKVCAEYRIDAANNSSGGGAVRDPLPCYERLAWRLSACQVPRREEAGARKLLASHYIQIARTRARLGDRSAARSLLWTRQATGNPVYWVRSVFAVR